MADTKGTIAENVADNIALGQTIYDNMGERVGNDESAPLLLIAGSEDHTVPASVDRSTYRKYRNSKAVTDFKEFPGRSHLIVAQEGWEEVAEYALAWVQDQPRRRDVVQPIRQEAT